MGLLAFDLRVVPTAGCCGAASMLPAAGSGRSLQQRKLSCMPQPSTRSVRHTRTSRPVKCESAEGIGGGRGGVSSGVQIQSGSCSRGWRACVQSGKRRAPVCSIAKLSSYTSPLRQLL